MTKTAHCSGMASTATTRIIVRQPRRSVGRRQHHHRRRDIEGEGRQDLGRATMIYHRAAAGK